MPPALSREQQDRLHDVHRQRQEELARIVALALAGMLAALPDLSDQSGDTYVASAVLVVAGGQRRAAALAAGYVRALAPKLLEQRAPVLELGDLAVTAATAWMRSPIIRGRTHLAAGEEWPHAIEQAGSYAGELASGDLQKAQRFGLDAGAHAIGQRARWRKILAPSACPWCVTVAGRSYHSADSVPFHERDRCSVAPNFKEA